MSRTPRAVAITAALAAAASGLALPLATRAVATAPVERAFVVADTDNDQFYGLGWQATPTGASTPVVAETLPVDIHGLSASRDGSRAIYIQDSFNASTGAPVSQSVVVRDASTRSVRVLDTQAFDNIHFLSAPQLSRDGSQAVWERYDDSGAGSVSVRKAAVASGAATTLAPGFSPYAFLDDDTLLVQDFSGNASTIHYSNGSTIGAATSIPVDAMSVTVSPDGSHLAWALHTGSSPNTSTIQIAALTVTNGLASASGVVTSDPGQNNRQPAWSLDGSKVYFIHNNGVYDANGVPGPGDVWSVNADGTGAAATAVTAADETDLAILQTDDVAPGQATLPYATLGGTSATLHWTNPADADLSGVVISRTGKSVFVPAPATSWVDTGLSLGGVYAYTITAVDRSGNSATAASRSLRAVSVSPTFGSPTSQNSARLPFGVRFATGDPKATVRYVVQYTPYGGTTKTWVNGARGASRGFGVAGNGSTVATTTSVAGANYDFTVRATDEFGNSSATVRSARAVVPFDQFKATYSGATTVSSSVAFMGSYRKISSPKAYAKVTLVGDRLQVIGAKCSSCGSFAIYAGSTKLATVSTYSSSTVVRAVLFTKSYTANGTRTFTIRPLGTAGHPAILLDGFASHRP